MKVGFIGLGHMGQAMARNVLAAGHELTVWNRTQARAEPLRELGAHVAESPVEVALRAEAVVTMLADDAAVCEITLGERGILPNLARGAVHVSSSTISVELSGKLAAAHAAMGQAYVAAPVFGRPDAAAAKQLWVLAAGPAQAIDRCMPILEAMGRGVSRLGDQAESANVVKLAGNFLIAAMIEALGEAFALARKSGVDRGAFLDVFQSVMGRSAIFERYASLIAAEAYEPAGFKLHLGLKDMRLALAAGDAAEVPMPLASLIRDQLLSAVALGKGEQDWAALAELAADRAGINGGR